VAPVEGITIERGYPFSEIHSVPVFFTFIVQGEQEIHDQTVTYNNSLDIA
jgi:hypothetical protein